MDDAWFGRCSMTSAATRNWPGRFFPVPHRMTKAELIERLKLVEVHPDDLRHLPGRDTAV